MKSCTFLLLLIEFILLISYQVYAETETEIEVVCFQNKTKIWTNHTCVDHTSICSERTNSFQCDYGPMCIWDKNNQQCTERHASIIDISSCQTRSLLQCESDNQCDFDRVSLMCVQNRYFACQNLEMIECESTRGCAWSSNMSCNPLSRDDTLLCADLHSDSSCVYPCQWDPPFCSVPEQRIYSYAYEFYCERDPLHPFDDISYSRSEHSCLADASVLCTVNQLHNTTAMHACEPNPTFVCPTQSDRYMCNYYSFCHWDTNHCITRSSAAITTVIIIDGNTTTITTIKSDTVSWQAWDIVYVVTSSVFLFLVCLFCMSMQLFYSNERRRFKIVKHPHSIKKN